MRTRQRGLTLVELMVVVAVMAVIAAVAYPLYTNQVQKSRRADAKIALETIAMAQERFYTINGRFSDDYTELYTGTLAAGAGLAWPCTDTDTCSTAKGYYVVDIRHVTDDQDFEVEATKSGIQAGDDDCAEFTLNQLGVKTATDGGSTSCW